MIHRRRLRRFILRTGTALCVLIAAAFVVSAFWHCAVDIPDSIFVAVGGGMLMMGNGDLFADIWTFEPLEYLFGSGPNLSSWNSWRRSPLFITVPLYALFLAAALPTLFVWRFTARFPRGHCHRCGYNLYGLTEPRCPECGTAISSDADRRFSSALAALAVRMRTYVAWAGVAFMLTIVTLFILSNWWTIAWRNSNQTSLTLYSGVFGSVRYQPPVGKTFFGRHNEGLRHWNDWETMFLFVSQRTSPNPDARTHYHWIRNSATPLYVPFITISVATGLWLVLVPKAPSTSHQDEVRPNRGRI